MPNITSEEVEVVGKKESLLTNSEDIGEVVEEGEIILQDTHVTHLAGQS